MRTVLLALSALVFSPAYADIGEGNWELEITTTMPGKPAASIKQVQCMTAVDAKDPANLIGGPGPGCAFNNRKDDGSTFSFDVACTSGAPLTGSGKLQYSREALNGEIVVNMKQGEQSMEVRTLLKAKRLGACR